MALTANHRLLVETSGFLKGLPMASIARAAYGRERVNSVCLWRTLVRRCYGNRHNLSFDDFRATARPFSVEVAIFAVFWIRRATSGLLQLQHAIGSGHLQRFSAHRYAGFHAHRSQQGMSTRLVVIAREGIPRPQDTSRGSSARASTRSDCSEVAFRRDIDRDVAGQRFHSSLQQYRFCGSCRLFSVNRSEKEKRINKLKIRRAFIFILVIGASSNCAIVAMAVFIVFHDSNRTSLS